MCAFPTSDLCDIICIYLSLKEGKGRSVVLSWLDEWMDGRMLTFECVSCPVICV